MSIVIKYFRISLQIRSRLSHLRAHSMSILGPWGDIYRLKGSGDVALGIIFGNLFGSP
jgi:hypothetical protein